MYRWFLADTHFSHANIIKYTGRPFDSVENMNAILIDNWNRCVCKDDIVFFLGDFGMGTVESLNKIYSSLQGRKICIRGNHDGTSSKLNRIGFDVVLESAFIKIGHHIVELVHHPSQEQPNHFQLHGHCHEKRPSILVGNQLNLCLEVWDYKPVHEKQIMSLLDKKSIAEINSTK